MIESKRWACIKDGKVELIIVWDGVQSWPPSQEYKMVEIPNELSVAFDWDYTNGEFVDNRPVAEEI